MAVCQPMKMEGQKPAWTEAWNSPVVGSSQGLLEARWNLVLGRGYMQWAQESSHHPTA